MILYDLFLMHSFTRYDKNPCSFAPEWFGPVMHPALKQTVFKLKLFLNSELINQHKF